MEVRASSGWEERIHILMLCFTSRLAARTGATHFILDFDFWIANATVAQGLEFDIFYSRDGFKNYFLTECDSRGMYAGTWQVSDVVIDT
jgi:hypothetical protein